MLSMQNLLVSVLYEDEILLKVLWFELTVVFTSFSHNFWAREMDVRVVFYY